MNPIIDPLREQVWTRLGKDTIEALHRENRLLDFAALAGLPALFAGLAVALAILPAGPLWLLCLILQGFLIQALALANHDLIVHRRVLPEPWSHVLGVMLMTPALMSATRYHYGHLAHHRHLGGNGDSELFKIDIDSTARRLIFFTFPGVKLASAGRFARRRRRIDPPIIRPDMVVAIRRIRAETRVAFIWLGAVAALAALWPELAVYGYLLPLLLVAPVANSLRTTLEHSEFEPDQPFHINCFYRTGWLTRPLFFWDAGDCHLVHHIFPRIPYYRMGAALTHLRPLIIEAGVVERRNLWALVWDWIVRPHPYRTPRRAPVAAG